MSGGGGGIIIIKNLIENPDTTAEEKDLCRKVEGCMVAGRRVSKSDARKVGKITERLVLAG